jgi:protein-S-isoprenylcysteine O-methyltransferase Ste14
MSSRRSTSKFLSVFGWLAIVLFVGIYLVEVFPHHGAPVTIGWIHEHFGISGLIVLNIVIVLAFLALLPFRRPTKNVWKSHGAFFAFVIALMTEMFGWNLFIFLASPILEVPRIAPGYFDTIGHWPASVGTGLSLLGVALIAAGWMQIHKAEDLVSTGLYKYMRHPQYTGIFLFTFGWIIHYPTILTLILWPILIAAYVWLARFEEKQAVAEFGESYETYASQTKRFIPFLI